MLIFAFFTAFSPLLIVAAPLPACGHPTKVDSNPYITLYRRAPPKFDIPKGFLKQSQKQDALGRMAEHYNTKATDEEKMARLASAASRWGALPDGQEFMSFNYHAGDTKDSPVISTARIVREKPVPTMHFKNVRKIQQEEMTTVGKKRYNDLSDTEASKVKSMKMWGDWSPKGGITEKTDLTFHSASRPKPDNIIGAPMAVRRPLTLQIGDVPLMDRIPIENDVRAAHKQMIANEQHPASKSNYGTVDSGWHDSLPDADGNTHKQVVVHLHEVSEDEKQRTPLGSYPVRMSSSDHESPGLNTGSSTLHTGTSSAVPSRLNYEGPHPSSQDHLRLTLGNPPMNSLPPNTGSSHSDSQGTSQFNPGNPSSHHGSSNPVSPHQVPQPHIGHLTLGLSTNALPSYTGSSHPNSQGTSQFDTGSPSSHPGPTHPESSNPVSPHQPLQPHVDSPPQHDKFNIASPDLWPQRDLEPQAPRNTWDLMHPDPTRKFKIASPDLWRPRDPDPQPSHDTWDSMHPELMHLSS